MSPEAEIEQFVSRLMDSARREGLCRQRHASLLLMAVVATVLTIGLVAGGILFSS